MFASLYEKVDECAIFGLNVTGISIIIKAVKNLTLIAHFE